jgi:hypothetical protein
MPLSQPIDLYCERLDPSFWAEPVNAWSNISFLIAASLLRGAIQRSHSQGQSVSTGVRALPVLLLLVGICSFVFHTVATAGTNLVDQLAILLFAAVFLFAFLRNVAAVPALAAGGTAVLFSGLSYLTPRWLASGFLNQSAAYFPYLCGLLAILIWLGLRKRPTMRLFLGAVLLFCLALVLRTVDLWICPLFPLGTHWLWHVLNGAVLLLLSLSVLRESQPGS